MLKECEFDGKIPLSALEHHERLDGSGYPGKKEAKDLNAHSRALAIIDVYEALTNWRPYKEPLFPMQALEIMKYEVTNADYARFLNAAIAAVDIYVVASSVVGMYPGDERLLDDDYTYYVLNNPGSRISWSGGEFVVEAGYALHPVTQVTWFGAWAYAERYGYSLPNEKEWEKAARADTGNDYPWGDSSPDCELCNFSGCVGSPRRIGASTGSSPYNVQDMAGNVEEWTADYVEAVGVSKVFRGGSFNSTSATLTSWYRNSANPAFAEEYRGFRCVRPIPGS